MGGPPGGRSAGSAAPDGGADPRADRRGSDLTATRRVLVRNEPADDRLDRAWLGAGHTEAAAPAAADPADTIERIEALDQVSARQGHHAIAGRLARGAGGGLRTPPHAHTTIRRYRSPRPTRRNGVRRDPPEHAHQVWRMDDCQFLQMALTPQEKRAIALDELLRQPFDALELYLPHVRESESLLGCVRRLTRRKRGRK